MSARRRILAVLLVAGALTAGPAAGTATASGQDQAAVAVNTKDGSSVFRLAFSVRRVMGDVVDQENVALAYASCESCQTVAISIQVLLVAGDPDVVNPTNLAIAINDMCTLCETLASAYQFVIGGDARLTLTPQGRRQVQEIGRGLRELGRQDLSIGEVQARVDALADDLREVLAEELVVKTRGDDKDDADREDGEDGEGGEGSEEPAEGEEDEDEQPEGPTTTAPPDTSTTPQEPDEDRPAPSDQTTTP